MIAKHATWNQIPAGPTGQRLAQVICSASDNIEITECLGLQASLLLNIPKPLQGTVYADAFTRMVAKRSERLARQQKFLLTSPNLYVPLKFFNSLHPNFQQFQNVRSCYSLLATLFSSTLAEGYV